MTIIEKEIAEREELIAAKEEKLKLAEEYLLKATVLKEEADAINADVLNAEIAELKSYLPAPVEDAIASVVEEVTPVVNA